MAKLTYQKRKKLPSSAFAEKSARKYPMMDESHARNALGRVTQHGSPAEMEKVRAAVHKKFPSMEIENMPRHKRQSKYRN